MNKKEIINTEKIYYEYYEYCDIIKCKNEKIILLDKQINNLKKDIKETNITIVSDIKGIKYSEKIQKSVNNNSYVEIAAIKEIEKLENLIKDKINKKNKTKEEIMKIELEQQQVKYHIENNIIKLGEGYIEFIELLYRYKKDIKDIAKELNISEPTAYRRRKEILEETYSWILKLETNDKKMIKK